MKLIVKFIILWSISFSSYRSQNCEYDKNEVDEFTKKNVKITKLQTVSNVHNSEKTEALHFSLKSLNQDKFLEISYQRRIFFGGSTIYTLGSNSELLLKLDNDTIIKLKFIGNTKISDSYIQSTYTEYSIVGNFILSDDNIKILKKYPLKKIRINFENQYVDIDVSEKIKKPLGGLNFFGEKSINPRNYFIAFYKCIE